MTEYNLPCKLGAEGREEAAVRPAGEETARQPSAPPRAAGASQVPPRAGRPAPAPAAASRRLPPYRTLPGRASSGAGPPPWPPRGSRRVSSVRFSAEVTRAEM